MEEFESNANNFLSHEDEAGFQRAIEWLDSWHLKESFLAEATAIIDTSLKPKHVFLAVTAIQHAIPEISESQDQSDLEKIFSSCQYRLSNSLIELDQTVVASLINVMSLIAVKDSEHISRWTELSTDNEVLFLESVFSLSSEPGLSIPPATYQKLETFSMDLMSILKKAALSSEWVSLFRYAVKYSDDLSAFSELLPRIRTFIDRTDMIPSLLRFFEEAMNADPSSSAQFQINVIELITDFCELPLKDQSSEEFASPAVFAWECIVDSDFSFYGTQFIKSLTSKLIISLNFFFERNLCSPEFIETVASFYGGLLSRKCFLEDIKSFIQILPANDTILSAAILAFSSMDPINCADFLQRTVPPNFFQIAAFCCKEARKLLSCSLSERAASDLSAVPPLFIQRCGKYSEKHLGIFLSYLIQMYQSFPSIEIALAIRSISRRCIPKEIDALIESLGKFGNELGIVICSAIQRFRPEEAFTFLSSFCEANLTNSSKETICEFLSQLSSFMSKTDQNFFFLDSFFDRLSDIFAINSDEIQCSCCRVFRKAIKHRWIENRGRVLEWVERMSQVCLTSEHILLLRQLTDLLPSDGVMRLILDVRLVEDSEAALEILRFLVYLNDTSWSYFYESFSPEFLVSLLEFSDVRADEIILDLIFSVLQKAKDQNFANLCVKALLDAAFSHFSVDSIGKAFRILVFIRENCVGPDEIIGFMHNMMPMSTGECRQFDRLFSASPVAIQQCLQAFKELISVMKTHDE